MSALHMADIDLPWAPGAEVVVLDRMGGRVGPSASGLPRRRKVAIAAAGQGKWSVPFYDDAYEVWALNVVPPLTPEHELRADRWFEIHEMHAQSPDDLRWIQKCPVPIYLPPSAFDDDGRVVLRHLAGCPAMEVPNAVRYPIEAVEAAYGEYWACTFAYQIALALSEGFTTIGLYGVELALGTDRERTVEWANVSWWVGFAEARGVDIELPANSTLGQHRGRYGLEYDREKSGVEQLMALHRRRDRQERFGMGG